MWILHDCCFSPLSLQTVEQPWIALLCLHFGAAFVGIAHKAHTHTRDESDQMDKSSCINDYTAIKAHFAGCYLDVVVLLPVSDVCRGVGREQDVSHRRGGSEQRQDGHRALKRAIQHHQRETETTNSCHLLQER